MWDGGKEGGSGIETPSCSWLIVSWNIAFERAGILQKFTEMSFTKVEIEGPMIIIKIFSEGLLLDFFIPYMNKQNLNESLHMQKLLTNRPSCSCIFYTCSVTLEVC